MRKKKVGPSHAEEEVGTGEEPREDANGVERYDKIKRIVQPTTSVPSRNARGTSGVTGSLGD